MPKYVDIEPIIRYSEIRGFDVATVALLKDLPTADVRENVHGKWIKNDKSAGWHCSCCGGDDWYAYISGEGDVEYKLQDKYCPNCGARMDQ